MHTPTTSDQTVRTGTGPLARYDSAETMAGIPSRNDIVAEYNNGMTAILQQCLSNKQSIHFMPTAVSDEAEYINGVSTYILRISGCLINGQKAIVNIMGIKPFFDVVVPEEIPLSMFKTKLVKIISNILGSASKFGIKTISAFPLRGYHTEKKPYIYVRTWNHYDRYNVLKAVRAVDIETYSSRKTGEVPNAKYEEDIVFMICMTIHWKDDPEPIRFMLETLAPDIQIGFNDSQYDWRFIVKRAEKLGVLEWMFNHMSIKPSSIEKILQWQYQYNAIKVNDGKFHSKHLKILGYVAIDVRPCFMKLYSKAEKSSLAFFLNEYGLESKLDMSFHRMFKYYEGTLKETNDITTEQMHEIAEYCINDALSCQWLMIKRNVINEYREVASIAFILLFDTHYFAVGMKVRNLLSTNAWREGILTSTIPCEQTETGKYPGAYVFPPVKGLENKRPVTGLDFASLYLSLIMAYNLSPDKIILSPGHAESLKKSGKKLHEITFKFNSRDIIAWSIEHENQAEIKGLYPKVLEELLIRRNSFKKRLAPLKNKKEKLEKEISLAEARGEAVTDALKSKYSLVSFNVACLDAKQLALKLYMNAFYGEAGNSESPFFLRKLAGGVTSAGQRNIKLIADLVRSKGFGVKYGDTDSLYLVCPEEYFQECDEKYNLEEISKEKYWEDMVRISMKVISELRDEVNDFLKKDKGSSYLKMAYEEPKKLFIRGVDTEKRGQSNLFRRTGKRIMDESMKVNNTCTLHKIVEDDLKETVTNISQIDLNEIIKTAVWKPDKNNKKPGERFEYVVVENDSSQKIGDKMEYPEVVRRLGKKIDINYYLKTVIGLCARFINYDDRHQLSSENLLETLKKLKDDNEVDEDEVNKDEVDEEDEDEVDEDKVSKIRDALAQKSAEKWVRGYIKNLHEGPKKDETIIAHLWKEAHTYAKNLYDTTYADKIVKCSENNTYWSFFLSALDKQEESIRIKLTTLLAEISQDDIGNREEMYKLVTKAGKHKSKAMTLEKYMLTYIQENEYEILADLRNTWYKVVGLEITRYRASSKLQGDKKDNSSEADIDEIIELYY
ncbi:hypothetical protein C2G38_2208747 [Gigaspora rosea]|uniref:DNA polymerase n=1 Tax=Gigaspora rosea TaxID=44941 RepID=A0A397UGT4_9GLOM|nr:hypothetical protein C2G38_2208747 [Gigaspora rosea]